MTSKANEIADPTIRQVLEEFLGQQQKRLAARTFARYREVIGFLEDSLDGYAYNELDDDETELYERFFDAEGDEHREFCDIFGPEHILPNLSEFLGYFLIRKVIGYHGLLKDAGTVTRKLTKWLVESGYADDVEDADPSAQRMARDLAKVEKLTKALHRIAPAMGILPDSEDLEGHFDITRILGRKLWVRDLGGDKVGPIELPAGVIELCQVGWTISGIVGRRGGKWTLLEAWNVYP